MVMVLQGERTTRMIFDRKKDLLRVIDDTGRKYFDLDSRTLDDLGSAMPGAAAQMEQSLASLPPEQWAMAESMMKKTMRSPAESSPARFVKSTERKSIAGYDSSRYDLMQKDVRRSESWTSTHPDFTMTPEEVEALWAMQDHLARFIDTVSTVLRDVAGSSAQTLRYDRSVEGFPVRAESLDGSSVTCEITLKHVDHSPLDMTLLEVPAGYQRQELSPPK